ncbi:hypothetical protein, partial [Ruminococcus sp.]
CNIIEFYHNISPLYECIYINIIKSDIVAVNYFYIVFKICSDTTYFEKLFVYAKSDNNNNPSDNAY